MRPRPRRGWRNRNRWLIARGKGTCGIHGEQWRRLIDEATRDDAVRAAELLAASGCPPSDVSIDGGPSLSEITLSAAARLGCDVVAVRRKRRPRSAGLSRRQLRRLHRAAPGRIVEI